MTFSAGFYFASFMYLLVGAFCAGLMAVDRWEDAGSRWGGKLAALGFILGVLFFWVFVCLYLLLSVFFESVWSGLQINGWRRYFRGGFDNMQDRHKEALLYYWDQEKSGWNLSAKWLYRKIAKRNGVLLP